MANQFERLNIMGINYRIPDLEGFHRNNAFIGEGTVKVTCLDPNAEIHYTTDGSTPTLQSPKYEGPIQVKEQRTLRSAPSVPTEKPVTSPGHASSRANMLRLRLSLPLPKDCRLNGMSLKATSVQTSLKHR